MVYLYIWTKQRKQLALPISLPSLTGCHASPLPWDRGVQRTKGGAGENDRTDKGRRAEEVVPETQSGWLGCPSFCVSVESFPIQVHNWTCCASTVPFPGSQHVWSTCLTLDNLIPALLSPSWPLCPCPTSQIIAREKQLSAEEPAFSSLHLHEKLKINTGEKNREKSKKLCYGKTQIKPAHLSRLCKTFLESGKCSKGRKIWFEEMNSS